jgi:glucosamine-6-phosphate deaminase
MTVVSAIERRYGELSVTIHPDGASLAAAAASEAAAVIAKCQQPNVMLATGNSQLAFLTELTTRPDIRWEEVRIFHMDEYLGLPDDHPAGFATYIRHRVVDAVHPLEAHYVEPTEAGPERYAELLRRHPIDLCVMGIGENGHLAFNDPGVADFADPADVKIVELDEICRVQQVGERHFPAVDDVPTHAVTVTVPALLRAGRVIVVCPEARKANAVHRALLGPIEPACPASVLRRTPRAHLHLDAESAKTLPH